MLPHTMNNPFYQRAMRSAQRFLKNERKLAAWFNQYRSKMIQHKGKAGEAGNILISFVQMLGDWINGSYRTIPTSLLIKMVAALFYFINPLDLIPDFLPAMGFVDDIGVLLWVYRGMQKEVDNYKHWKQKVVSES